MKLAAPKPYQIVLWLSAKKRRFLEGAIVSIDTPDFVDLDSALNRILTYYGWAEEIDKSAEQKKKRVLELIDTFPALMVVDDVDTMEGQDEDAIEFFSFSVPQTRSKVLFTSRRQVFGMGGTTTHIGGLDQQDAERFIYSRCRLMELDPSMLTKETVREIIKVTESSPLYIEDLMRLFAIVPPREAIKLWREKAGNEARQYALGRELELLSNDARHVLIAACIRQGPVSFAELEALTGLSEDRITGSIGELQRLFLVPKPRLIEGEQRFDVNVNTRGLISKVMQSSDLYRRVTAAERAVSGGLPKTGRGEVASLIRQSVFLVRNQKQEEAEKLLSAALEKYLNDPGLTAFLAWVYKAWVPVRVTDAREKFKRAFQLKCANQDMYKHWARMEINEHEWTKAAEAGLKFLPESQQLLFLAGYARGRLARELAARLHADRAEEEVRKSQQHLVRALRAPESLEAGQRRLNADIYRALVLNCELLKDPKGLGEYFAFWLKEHPDDPDAKSEWERLSGRFGLVA